MSACPECGSRSDCVCGADPNEIACMYQEEIESLEARIQELEEIIEKLTREIEILEQ